MYMHHTDKCTHKTHVCTGRTGREFIRLAEILEKEIKAREEVLSKTYTQVEFKQLLCVSDFKQDPAKIINVIKPLE